MKAAPTLDGRIRIDVESPTDLMVLQAIIVDARSADDDLADRLADGFEDESVAADWKDYVVDDLREDFGGQLQVIGRAVSKLEGESGRPLFIVAEDAMAWYGGLNQARLALEDRFGLSGLHSPKRLPAAERSAWLRSQFYQTLQSMIFEFLMRD